MGQRSRVLYKRAHNDDNYVDDDLIESLSKTAAPVVHDLEICFSIAGLLVERVCSVCNLFSIDKLLLSKASGTVASYILVVCSGLVILTNSRRFRLSQIAVTDSISLFVLLTQSVRVLKLLSEAFDPNSLESLAQWLSLVHLISHDYGGYRSRAPTRRLPVLGAEDAHPIDGPHPPCKEGHTHPPCKEGHMGDIHNSVPASSVIPQAQAQLQQEAEQQPSTSTGLAGGILSFNSAMFASALLSGRHTDVWHAFLLIAAALHVFVTMPHLATRLLRAMQPKRTIAVQWLYAAASLCLLSWTHGAESSSIVTLLSAFLLLAGCMCPVMYYLAQYRFKVWPVGDWDCEEVVPASSSS